MVGFVAYQSVCCSGPDQHKLWLLSGVDIWSDTPETCLAFAFVLHKWNSGLNNRYVNVSWVQTEIPQIKCQDIYGAQRMEPQPTASRQKFSRIHLNIATSSGWVSTFSTHTLGSLMMNPDDFLTAPLAPPRGWHSLVLSETSRHRQV